MVNSQSLTVFHELCGLFSGSPVHGVLSPDDDNDDDVANSYDDGGNKEENNSDAGHVQLKAGKKYTS